MKKIIISLVFVLMMCFTFTSCHKNDLGSYDWNGIQKENFVKDFNKAFGVNEADYATNDWGMNLIPVIDITANSQATRAAHPNNNEWGVTGTNYANIVVPAAVTSDEITKVYNHFSSVGAASYTALVDWDCFFVQQVWKGTAKYKAGNGGDVVGGNQMDWLCAYDKAGHKEMVYGRPEYNYQPHEITSHDDHVNNFNNSNGSIMLMMGSSTQRFGFKSSTDNGHIFYNFRMVDGKDIDPSLAGAYYVGLDFEAAGQNPNEQVARDLIYNDWIVKIVPGYGTPDTEVERVRIMAEDLGTQVSDFDYNDIVFDIKFIKNGNVYVADIVLQAAGGTLPLTIGGNEVHNLFAVANDDPTITTETMINTGAGHHNDYSPVHFTVTLNGNYSNAWDAINALPIIVLYNDTPIQLTVNPGSPAEMIAVPTTTDWSDERVSIRNRYPAFVTWISDSTIQWWE